MKHIKLYESFLKENATEKFIEYVGSLDYESDPVFNDIYREVMDTEEEKEYTQEDVVELSDAIADMDDSQVLNIAKKFGYQS
jgi:hypothetical protein